MNITTSPASRFGWEGQTVEYVVRAEGAAELLAPTDCPDELKVRIVDTRDVGDGVEALVAVDVAGPVMY
ncbi:MAG: hypothetical protein ACYC6C_06230 [Coriobacteriia bacterium]